MAVLYPNPNIFLSKPTQRENEERDGRQHNKWRLSSKHIADLRAVATGIEETDMGICCKYLIDQRSGLGADYDETALDVFENFCETHEVWKDPSILNWRRRIQRCRRAIARMYTRGEHKHVAVLYVVYGYVDPFTHELSQTVLDSLGNMASLARYTDVVEVRRQEMARQEGIKSSAERRIKYANEAAVNADAYRHDLKPEYFATLIDIVHTRDRVKWADKAISSGDAVRSMFAPIHERYADETSEHYKERKENLEAKRDNWMVQIKIETTKMLELANNAYFHSWVAAG